MDISVLASVGSFVVSERVLKPKASVLVILGCVLAYDLTTKTHDSSSLRVYRGPGLLAFCLMMVAYSLRTWRRNGVACDELLFLPGTPHGDSTIPTTSTSGSATTTNGGNSSSSSTGSPMNHHPTSSPSHGVGSTTTATTSSPPPLRSEGDVAAGGSWINTTTTSTTTAAATNTTANSLMFMPPQRSFSQRSRARSLSHDSSLSSIHEFVNNWEEDEVDNNGNDNDDGDGESHRPSPPQLPRRSGGSNNPPVRQQLLDTDEDDDDVDNEDDTQQLMMPLTSSTDNGVGDHHVGRNHNIHTHSISSNNNNNHTNHTSLTTTSETPNHMNHNHSHATTTTNTTTTTTNNNNQNHSRMERFRDHHPNVTRIGSFFFFRSSTSSTHNAAYAPSGPSVVGAAIDLSMPVLFNFHLFIEAWNRMDSYNNSNSSNHNNNYDDDNNHHDGTSSNSGSSDTNFSHNDSNNGGGGGGDASAKILPLIFLSVLIVRTFFPPGRRGRFWSTMKFTAGAPFYRSRFRDCYIGDVLTSLVRPFQDVVFALAYYVTVIWGSITAKYNLSESGHILERSWILHNVVLPTIALLPLWWKFLQTLRESYDTGKRWPYLGNAFKYLTAAIVILYGMTHPEDRRSVWWIVSFGLTLTYQVFWDTVMDWDLFVIAPKEIYGDTNSSLDISESTMWFNRPISSMRPSDSYWLLSLQRHILPIRECVRSWWVRFPSYKQIQVRSRRLYKSELFYWRIFCYNTIFRFCWMLSFIPAYHFSSSGRDVITTFSSDTHSYVGVLLPIAEILRRTLWGFLYLEIQTIKMTDGESCHQLYTSINGNDPSNGVGCDDTIEMSSLLQDSSKHGPSRFQQHHHYLPAWLGMQQQLQHDMVSTNATTSTATTTSVSPNASSSSIWFVGHWFQYSDRMRRKLFLMELSMWAMAFVGLGIWATM